VRSPPGSRLADRETETSKGRGSRGCQEKVLSASNILGDEHHSGGGVLRARSASRRWTGGVAIKGGGVSPCEQERESRGVSHHAAETERREENVVMKIALPMEEGEAGKKDSVESIPRKRSSLR